MTVDELWERVVQAERRAAAAEAELAQMRAAMEQRLEKQRVRKARFLSKHVPDAQGTSENVPERSGTSESVPTPSPASPPVPSPDSPHTPHITPTLPPASPPPPVIAAAPAAPRPPKGRSAGGGAKYPAFPEADCDALWIQWGSTFGAVEYGTFRKALGPHYQAAQTPPSVAQMADAIRAYREAVDEMDEREAGWQSVHKFAQRIEHWLRLGAMPHTNEWGELTERGRVLGSKALREQERAGRMRVSA